VSTGLNIAAATTAALAGPRLRAAIFAHSVAYGRPARRACPACRHRLPTTGLAARLAVTGRCPKCLHRIGASTGLVEVVAAITVLLATARTSHWALALAGLWIGVHGIVLAGIDITVHRLPDRIIASAYLGTGTMLVLAAWATGSWTRLASAAAGSAGLAAFYLTLHLAAPSHLGPGDVKLALLIGLAAGWHGFSAVIATAMAIAVLGMLTAGYLLAAGRPQRGDAFAAGPVMLTGALLVILLQPAVSA